MHCAFLPDDINVDGNHRLISPPTTLPAGITTCSLYLPIIFLSLRCPLHKFLNSLTNVIRTLNPTLDEDPILPVIAELEMVTQILRREGQKRVKMLSGTKVVAHELAHAVPIHRALTAMPGVAPGATVGAGGL
ncbi:hypothetical protein H4582DRAFT_2060451 [Lactarius indigo]|nr:hypothetical protein H4582DRAFT_2060451 [Lactarius indigo]